MDRFRLISDLHLDINDNYPLQVKKDNIFTIVAGDTSGEWTIIDYCASDKHLRVDIGKHSKTANYFNMLGKNGKVEIIYDSDKKEWKNIKTNTTINLKDADIKINNFIYGKILNGTTIKFKFIDVERIVRKNISKGLIIAGNHIVYNKEGKTIEELKRDMNKRFPIDSNISFMDYSTGTMTKEVDGILFIGSTLYTDYEYVGDSITYLKDKSKDKIIEYNLNRPMPKMSGSYLNDFNFGKTYDGMYKKDVFDEDEKRYFLTSKNYLKWFHETFDEITNIVESNIDKDIVIISHHCPSPKCISLEYVNDDMNASYISNLEKFIISHPNIKCWCCGHVHHRESFKIGNCLIVMNPCGYCTSGQFGGDNTWSFNTFVNTKTWSLEKEPFDLSTWKKKYQKALQEREKIYKKFGGLFI